MEMETEAKEDRAHTVREIYREKVGPTGKYLRLLNGDIQENKGVLQGKKRDFCARKRVSARGPFSLVSLHLVQFGKPVCKVSTPGKKLVVDTVRGREDKESNERGKN